MSALKSKIILCLCILTVCLIAGFSFVAYQAQEQAQSVEIIIQQGEVIATTEMDMVKVIKDINFDIAQVQQWLTDISATRGLDKLNDGFDKADFYAKAFEEHTALAIKLAEKMNLSAINDSILDLKQKFPAYYATGQKMAHAYIDGGPESGNKLMSSFDATAEEMGSGLEKLIKNLETITLEASSNFIQQKGYVEHQNKILNTALISISIMCVLLCMAIGAYIIRFVFAPLELMTNAMRRLASSDWSTVVTGIGRKDEIGEMAKAIDVFKTNGMEAEKLRAEHEKEEEEKGVLQRRNAEYIRDFELTIMDVLESVKSADNLMKRTAYEMGKSADETNAQAIIVATGAEEASSNVQTIASAADELSSSIQEISRQMITSSEITGKAIRAAGEGTKEIKQLEAMVSKIGNIVQLITDIAKQTNLLALNATIEAARAGDAGKGFAVVASEVKALASQTAKATEEISQQIRSVQQCTEASAQSLRGISEIVSEISGVSTSISSAVEQQNSATSAIAKNVEQASIGTAEVSNSIVNVRQSTEESKKAALEIKDSSDLLAEQTQVLNGNVSAFLIKIRASDSSDNSEIIKWSDAIAIGNATIDSEHKKLIEIVNKLYALVRSGTKGNDVVLAYDEMTAYTNYHFKHEEEEMARIKYSDFEKHKLQHQKFSERLHEYYIFYKSGKDTSGEPLLNLLGSWWVSHILTSDKKLAGHMPHRTQHSV